MLPIRGSEGNPVLCETPASEDPKPPDPGDLPPSLSLLKAFEAVVAAGKRGLLGPAAMAAAAAAAAANIPGLNQSTSDGLFFREAQNPIPLLSDQRKREKASNQKRIAVRTVVQPAEFKTDVGSLKPSLKEVWICGNSVILASKNRAKSNSHGLQLGIPASRAYVYWHGIQAMKWEKLLPLLHEIYQLRSPPSIIIIHLGEDDLLPEDNTSLLISMKNDLGILRRAFPDAVIIWSSLLPRFCSKKDQNPELMEKAQKQVNRKMVDYCNEIGVHFLSHNQITSHKTGLFLPNDTELSDAGADIFIADMKKVLRFYQIFG